MRAGYFETPGERDRVLEHVLVGLELPLRLHQLEERVADRPSPRSTGLPITRSVITEATPG